MGEITIEQASVTWRDYRKFSEHLREITPEDAEDITFDELKCAMLLAAVRAEWLEVPQIDVETSLEDLDDLPAMVVMPAMDAVYEFYTGLRTPDPN